jgi:ABC-type Zn uptake system ZnuABC Zn-binding protein ZnuA
LFAFLWAFEALSNIEDQLFPLNHSHSNSLMENPEDLTEKLSAIESRLKDLYAYISTVRKACLHDNLDHYADLLGMAEELNRLARTELAELKQVMSIPGIKID